MLSWKEIVQDYIVKHSDRIKKATRPLQERFGINYFTYHQIDKDGNYTVLVDNPEYAHRYVEEQIYLNDPYLRHPNVYQSGLCLAESQGSEEYKKTMLRAGKAVLNMDIVVMLIQKHEGTVEFLGFAGNQKTSSLQSLYLNHPQLLKSFAAHFKRELSCVLRQMAAEANSLIELKGEDFLCNQPICPEISLSSRLAYYRDIGLKTEAENVEKLSPREKECLKLLIEDKSAKETAAVLGLSHRTIESYFENIKNKLSCWSKHELLQIARNLEEFGLL